MVGGKVPRNAESWSFLLETSPMFTKPDSQGANGATNIVFIAGAGDEVDDIIGGASEEFL